MRYQLLLIASLFAVSISAQEPEQPVEKPKPDPYVPQPQDIVIGEQLETLLPASEVKWLGDGDNRYLARSKTAETGQAMGNILLLPGPGKTINSAGYVRQAMAYYPTVSWHTMAIPAGPLEFSGPEVEIPETTKPVAQDAAEAPTDGAEPGTKPPKPEPVLKPEGAWYDAQQKANMALITARVKQASEQLPESQKGYVVITASASAGLLVSAIAAGDINPKALVILDIEHPVRTHQDKMMVDLAALSIPILDLYQPLNEAAAKKRQPLARKANYRQTMIPTVSADYVGVEDLLQRTIRGWLKVHSY